MNLKHPTKKRLSVSSRAETKTKIFFSFSLKNLGGRKKKGKNAKKNFWFGVVGTKWKRQVVSSCSKLPI